MLTSLIPSMALGGSNVRYLPAFNVLLMIALYALFCLKERENREHLWFYYKNNKYVLIAVILYIITIWISSYKTGAQEDLVMTAGISVVLLVLHFLMPVFIKTKHDFAFVVKAFLAIGLLMAIFTIALFILYKAKQVTYGISELSDTQNLSRKFSFLPDFEMQAVRGIFLNPNSLGIFMAIVFPSALFLFMENKKWIYKFMLILTMALFIGSLLGSFSRASIAAVVVSLLLFVAVRWSVIFNTVRIFFIGCVVVISSIIIAGIKIDIPDNVAKLSANRIALWNTAIEAIHDNMVSGIGVSNIIKFLPRQQSSHNTYIEIALGFGIGALIAYSLYLIIIVTKMRVNRDRPFTIYTLLTFSSFFVLQTVETLQFGGLSIANFYFLIVLVSYLSVTSVTRQRL